MSETNTPTPTPIPPQPAAPVIKPVTLVFVGPITNPDMKSGVKRHNPQERSQKEKSLATQDDRLNGA